MVGNPQRVSSFDRTDWRWLAGIAVASLVYPLFFFDRWIGLLDEGYIHAIAADIVRGRSLYGDVFIDSPFPGAFHLLAWWFQLFDTSVLSSRYLALVGFAIYVTAFFRILRAVVDRRWALLFVALLFAYRLWAFPHWQVYSYSLAAAALITLATALILHFRESPSPRGIFVAGLAAGGAILCKQDYGFGVTGGVGLSLLLIPFLCERTPAPWLRTLWRPFLFGLGALVPLTVCLAILAIQGVLPAFFEQTVLQPLRGATSFNPYPRMPDLLPLWSQDPDLRAQIGHYFPAILVTLFWGSISNGWLLRETPFWDITIKLAFWVPILSFATATTSWLWGAARWRSGNRGPIAAERFVLLGFAGGFLLAFPPPRDWTHLVMVLPPQVALLTVLASDLHARGPRPVRSLCWPTAVGVVSVLFATSLGLALELRRQMNVAIDSPYAGVWADGQNGPVLNRILAWAAEEEADLLPAYPLQPMVPFLAGREIAGGFHVIWPVQPAGRDLRIIADLEEARVERILYSLSQYAHLGSFRDNAPGLFDYLVEQFEIEQVFSDQPLGPLLVALRREADRSSIQALEGLKPEAGTWQKWPFARVLVPDRTGLALLTATLPPTVESLALAYGVNPDLWMSAPREPVSFALRVRDQSGRVLRQWNAGAIDPSTRVADRRWFPARIDLEGLAGRTVQLEFETHPPSSGDPRGGFKDLTLVTAALPSAARP
jgi:hypothetical protein